LLRPWLVDRRPLWSACAHEETGKSGKRSKFQELSGSTARLSGRVGAAGRDGVLDLEEELSMDGIIYLVGLVVIVMFVLSFFGLR
jgi:hypothetical protein